ncbi:hypothetical protein L917_20191 [Phytophthora nicotianae]|uniref:Uncharacterized protein n=2 Tax=Phytophthora nicotianae TaxID=4792 RepID=W2FQY9_PHYNI|nr:hypothetical protein L915_20457 [Phytophthora nicotianae]ETL25895.1 hypothetical protein L916_20319 [Phytophthora nicotianae]ETL79104.1 hypothetical protein L917_20191 [Phytophthora nicotianae]ETO58480.1 hypothetical protein F444_23147 [Phytophthora nicotianae P1976]
MDIPEDALALLVYFMPPKLLSQIAVYTTNKRFQFAPEQFEANSVGMAEK